MTFSSKVKNELCTERLYLKRCCNLAFLYGVFLFCKTYSKNQIKIHTENKNFALIIQNLLLELFDISINIDVFDAKTANDIFGIHIDGSSAEKVEQSFKILNNNNRINFEILKKRCDRASFLRGAFLSAGVVGDPDKHYHIDFLTSYNDLGNDLIVLLSGFLMNLKISTRKNSYILYSKESETIIDILNILGATNSALRFMEIKVLKDVRNNINRKVNFETANLSKTANASAIQIEAIEKIKKTAGLNFLPDKLKELAEIRLENPDMALSELGGLVSPQLSRSGVNHRLAKIIEIASQL